jgi:dipeptidyl aminopeptidase/acylaminoacyl peptidase
MSRSIILIAFLCLALRVNAADTSATGRFTAGRYLDLQSASAPQISPDGSQILYTRRMIDKQADKYQSAIWIVNADGSHHRFLAKGSGEVWSADGKSFAFLAEGEPKGMQIFSLQLGVSGPPSQLTWFTEEPGNLRWSPDGKWIGFTMKVPDAEKWAVDLPAALAYVSGPGRVHRACLAPSFLGGKRRRRTATGYERQLERGPEFIRSRHQR